MMRSRIGHPKLQRSIRLGIGHRRVRLSHEVTVFGRGEHVFAHQGGFAKSLFHLTHINGHMHIDIVGIVIMQQGSPLGHGLPYVQHRFKRFVLDLDQPQRPAGGFHIIGSHRGHFFAHVTHLFGGHQFLVTGVAEHAPLDACGVLAGNHGLHPRQGLCFACVDGLDARVGVGRTQHRGTEHAGQTDVASENRGAPGLGLGIYAGHAAADKFKGAHWPSSVA